MCNAVATYIVEVWRDLFSFPVRKVVVVVVVLVVVVHYTVRGIFPALAPPIPARGRAKFEDD